jgi:hypothetical protein
LELVVAYARPGLCHFALQVHRRLSGAASRSRSDIPSLRQTHHLTQLPTSRACCCGYGAAASSSLIAACALAAAVTSADPARATWKPEYANAAPEVQQWYRDAELTDAAQRRFGFKSCCAHSDVVKTSFRVDKATDGDAWYWLKDGQWAQIPSDIIHWGESAPDGQPTLFAIGNLPTCFYPGQGGL